MAVAPMNRLAHNKKRLKVPGRLSQVKIRAKCIEGAFSSNPQAEAYS